MTGEICDRQPTTIQRADERAAHRRVAAPERRNRQRVDGVFYGDGAEIAFEQIDSADTAGRGNVKGVEQLHGRHPG